MPVRPLVPVLAALLVLAPMSFVSAQDDGANRAGSVVTFYGHVFGHGYENAGAGNNGPMPANTEKPVGENNYGLGSFDWCTPVVNLEGLPPTPADESGCQADQNNKLVLFSTAGFVDLTDQADFEQKGGYALLHNERGQTKDVLLDPSTPIEARIFVSVDYHSWAVGNQYGTNCVAPHPPDVPCAYPYWGWDPGTQPGFVVKATLYSANLGSHGANASDVPPIGAAIESGNAKVIAEGQAGPADVTNGLPGFPNVNEFVIDLGPAQQQAIPRNEDFFIVYSFYSVIGGQEVGIHSWRIWSGEFFPPSFNLPVRNAFDVERVIPNFAHGKLALLAVMNTPWGSYDIDPKSVTLTIDGPNGNVEPERIARFGEFSVAHGGHYLPINVTWIWDYQGENLRPGTYTVTVSAKNFQHSAEASCSATFELKAPKSGQGPPIQGKVNEGVCGAQSASQEFLDELKEGASQTGGS